MSLEDKLREWSKPPSDSERERIDRTERMVREAIRESTDPHIKNATVFTKGSVKAGTNIKQNSDIDVCVMADGVFFPSYPNGLGAADFGNINSDYSFLTFRDGVERALANYFGSLFVDTSGNKHIEIRNTSSESRVDADVVPAFEHKRYSSLGSLPSSGIELRHKANHSSVINWPHHNYNNSVAKYNSTSQRYRRMVRILKWVREKILEQNPNAQFDAQSFLIESLLWNTPNARYGNTSYADDISGILGFLRAALQNDHSINEWGEVNELKYLFRSTQKWTREGALQFVNAADAYLGDL